MDAIALRTTNPNDRIALRGVRVRSRLAGMSQRTTVEQTFVNLEPQSVEAVYTFPLPDNAAVCGFEVVTGDRVLTGLVEESEQAIEKYEEAIGDGHAAYALEQVRPDVFTVRVGNIKPRQAATIRITYVAALERADKQIRVAFPTTVAPRYVTATGTDPLDAIVDGDALNAPHALHVPYGVSLEVEVDLGRDARNVFSPSHAIRLERRDEHTSFVTLSGGVAEMNRDIVLSIELAKETEPTVQIERGFKGECYLAVTFVPEFDVDELAAPQPSETFFVLDCSGSMQGGSIQQATAALELCLRSLSNGDTFNICRFGSTFELMSSEPLVYSQETLDRAVKYVRESRDLGGTELYHPLEAIFNVPPRAGKVRQVILMTDGQVSNEPACIQLARKHRTRNRIFTFGIGSASSANLVKGLARATGGAAEFITGGERIDEKVLRTFGRLTSPQVADVSIDWDGCDVQTLAELPPVFDGDVLAVFARAAGRAPAKVTLSCQTPAGPRKWTVSVPSPAMDQSDRTIATMWARRMIQSMEDVNAIQRTHAPSKDESRERQLLINLSKEFGLLCSLTTFIAIEHRSLEDRNEGRPALRRVPVQLAEGWGNVDPGATMLGGMAMPAPMAMPAASARLYKSASMPDAARSAVPARKRGWLRKLGRQFSQHLAPGHAPAVGGGDADLSGFVDGSNTPAQLGVDESLNAPATDDLSIVLSGQQADGSFKWNEPLRSFAKQAGGAVWEAMVTRELAAAGTTSANDALVQTIVTLMLLQSEFASDEPLWQRATRKAVRDFLAPALGKSPADVEQWLADLLKIATSSA